MLLKKNKINDALELIAALGNLYVPGEENGVNKFVSWEKGADVNLEGLNTKLPPKDMLFPNTEKMYSYNMGKEQRIEEIVSSPVQIIMGIKPCDVRSIECMDKVFLEKGFVDNFYSRKRDNLTIISMGCTESGETCFCESMGLNPNLASGADLMMNDFKDSYFLEALTEKGEKIISAISDLLEEGGSREEKTHCSFSTNMTEDFPEKLKGMFDHEIWDEVANACVGCATCTYVCPTCYCFDIGSDNHGAEGTKFRCWDSCMFSDYARMAGGHDPRPSKKERVRNRYMHKLSYYNERYGMNLCVGCGRCVGSCPSSMDITDFINKAQEVK